MNTCQSDRQDSYCLDNRSISYYWWKN